jgi:hypothetical protein
MSQAKVFQHKFPAKRPVRKAAGQFDYPTTLVGNTQWVGQDGIGVTVYYDPSLGQQGLDLANNILPRLEDLMVYLDTVFGVKGKGGNVIIAPLSTGHDGSGGAYHYNCAFNVDAPGGSDWYEDAAFGNPDLTFGLVMAEVCESYMGLQAKGWNCGGSGGEGLSRFLAEVVTGGASGSMSAYAAGPSWDGTDWISRDQGTDQDYPSIGCSILYVWWMTSLGYTVPQIVQAGEQDGTLSANYAVLTGKPASQAFTDFRVGITGTINSDNPYNAQNPPYPLSNPPPPTCPAGQHWDPTANNGAGACVPDAVPTGNTITITTSLPTGTYNIVASMSEHELAALPPWLLALLRILCTNAGTLPPPWGMLAGIVCGLLPHAAKAPCGCK